MDYNAFRISQSEHQHMVNSVPTVSEFGQHIVPAQPGWLARQTGRLLASVKEGLAARKTSAKPEQNQGLNGSLAEEHEAYQS